MIAWTRFGHLNTGEDNYRAVLLHAIWHTLWEEEESMLRHDIGARMSEWTVGYFLISSPFIPSIRAVGVWRTAGRAARKLYSRSDLRVIMWVRIGSNVNTNSNLPKMNCWCLKSQASLSSVCVCAWRPGCNPDLTHWIHCNLDHNQAFTVDYSTGPHVFVCLCNFKIEKTGCWWGNYKW